MAFKVALAGNPNCGKTTLFNEITGSTQRVGNWPGVTVDKKEGFYKKDKSFAILDLPGTYSLSPYSAEEIIARDYIVKERPDAVINIVDGTSIERNLYLTLQILETGVPTVVAMNMMDEVEAKGDKIDCKKLGEELGVEVVPIVARNGKGVEELMAAVKRTAEGKKAPKALPVYDHSELKKKANGDEDELEMLVADARYNYISGLVAKAVKKAQEGHVETKSDKIDKVLTNRILALPIFAVIMYVLFACVNSENFLFLGINSPGIWLAGIVETVWGFLTDSLAGLIEGASPWVYSLVIDGIMEGIGAVLGFLPLILVLYILISFLEDCGYMARIAFVLDRIFRRFGLSGRSFIPLLQGFGCSVPAVMGTRTLETEKDRKITTILAGFMPCGAKMPIFLLFISTFFVGSNQTLITFSVYVMSICIAIIVALVLNKFFYKDDTSNFIMELPQYRIPTVKSIAIHAWEKVKGYSLKAGSIIFISTILIWALSNFNVNSFNGVNAAENEDGAIMCDLDDSFMASIGNVIAPIFKPLGFGEWRPTVGVITGWIAKENVVATMAELYDDDVTDEYLEAFFADFDADELEELGFEGGEYDPEAAFDVYTESILFEGADENALHSMQSDMSKAGAYAYMMFNLFCMPCFAAVGAMRRELKDGKTLAFAICVQMVTAYIVALAANIICGFIW